MADEAQALDTPHEGDKVRENDVADVRALLMRSLTERWQTYGEQLKRCREEPSEDAVHDLRVAMRRLISTLMALDTILPDSHDHLRKVRRSLSKRLDRFSPLRDTQVQALTIQEMLTTFPELQPYYNYLTERERRLVGRIGKEVKKTGTARLERAAAIIAERLCARSGDPAAQEQARAAVLGAAEAAFNRVAKRRQKIDPTNAMTIHRMRVAFKKFRYLTEALEPMLDGIGREQLKSMGAFQDMMGKIQDTEVLLASLAAFLAGKSKAYKRTMRPAREELMRRRAAAIDEFLASADQIYTLWKPQQTPGAAQTPPEDGKA